MTRETTNTIRYLMDEFIPPVIRDSTWFMYPIFYFLYGGRGIRRKMNFKAIAYSMTEDEYRDFYNEIDVISGKRETDLCASNIGLILEKLDKDASSILDVGCGKGYLLDKIKKSGSAAKLTGLDMNNRLPIDGVEFVNGNILQLPFEDNSFDTVICTHTIEHIIRLQQAMDELIRVTRKQLIIVTPAQRYFYYTLDGHINYFYAQSELLRYLPFHSFICKKLDHDWVYIGWKNV